MSNLKIWDAVRKVPDTAKKPISGGRLNGKTDINPMWRLKVLTETYGPCGTGWYYDILEKTLSEGANGEIAAFVDIHLFVKEDGEWSKPIPGTGGSMFISKERSGMYTSDECYKMALTDAISVSCKALGIGADVYWEKDTTKYSTAQTAKQEPAKVQSKITASQSAAFQSLIGKCNDPEAAKSRLKQLREKKGAKSLSALSEAQADTLFKEFAKWVEEVNTEIPKQLDDTPLPFDMED